MKKYQFEVAKAVEDYLDDDVSRPLTGSDIAAAFQDITEDDGQDIAEAELELFGFRVEQFASMTTEFLETDSSNIGHANGYWLVTIRGEDAVVDDFVAKFAAFYDLEGQEAEEV